MDKFSESSISALNRCHNRIPVLQSSKNLLIRDNSLRCSAFSLPHHHSGHLRHPPPPLLPLPSPKSTASSHPRLIQRRSINAKHANLSRKGTRSGSSSFSANPKNGQSDFSKAKQLALHSTGLSSSFGRIGGEDTPQSICLVSPHPSSLPLPKFSLLPKIKSCKAEAMDGIDAGATDDLCRLLRLR